MVKTTQSLIILSCDSAILFFADQATGMNTDNTYKNASKGWHSWNTVRAKDKRMNSILTLKTLMTCETRTMFEHVASDMKEITIQVLSE